MNKKEPTLLIDDEDLVIGSEFMKEASTARDPIPKLKKPTKKEIVSLKRWKNPTTTNLSAFHLCSKVHDFDKPPCNSAEISVHT